VSWTTDHERLLAWSECEGLQLVDGRSGALVTLVPRPKGFDARVVSDGRIVLSGTEGDRGLAHVLTRDGAPERTLDLGAGDHVIVGGEVTPGKLVLALHSAPRSSRVLVADLDTGQVEQVADGLVPALGRSWWMSRSPRPLYIRGTALVRFDPITREERVIVGTPG
jgi:hypothetical protein